MVRAPFKEPQYLYKGVFCLFFIPQLRRKTTTVMHSKCSQMIKLANLLLLHFTPDASLDKGENQTKNQKLGHLITFVGGGGTIQNI